MKSLCCPKKLLASIFFCLFSYQAIADEGASLAIKNFREFRRSLSKSTGVSMNDQTVRQTYQQILSSLPKSGELSEITSSFLSGVVQLSAAYCIAMVEQERRLEGSPENRLPGWLWKARYPLDPKDEQELIRTFAKIFWKRKPSAKERDLLANLIEALASDSSQISSLRGLNTDEKLVIASVLTCTATASALDAWIDG